MGADTVSADDPNEWATAPLLRADNVGKLVWFSYNGDKASTAVIQKIGRTNIHVGPSYKTHSMRVNEDGESAYGMDGGSQGWSVSCFTEDKRLIDEEIRRLQVRITNVVGSYWNKVTLEQLRDIAFILGVSNEPS